MNSEVKKVNGDGIFLLTPILFPNCWGLVVFAVNL